MRLFLCFPMLLLLRLLCWCCGGGCWSACCRLVTVKILNLLLSIWTILLRLIKPIEHNDNGHNPHWKEILLELTIGRRHWKWSSTIQTNSWFSFQIETEFIVRELWRDRQDRIAVVSVVSWCVPSRWTFRFVLTGRTRPGPGSHLWPTGLEMSEVLIRDLISLH